jgi:hypothetical protein
MTGLHGTCAEPQCADELKMDVDPVNELESRLIADKTVEDPANRQQRDVNGDPGEAAVTAT